MATTESGKPPALAGTSSRWLRLVAVGLLVLAAGWMAVFSIAEAVGGESLSGHLLFILVSAVPFLILAWVARPRPEVAGWVLVGGSIAYAVLSFALQTYEDTVFFLVVPVVAGVLLLLGARSTHRSSGASR